MTSPDRPAARYFFDLSRKEALALLAEVVALQPVLAGQLVDEIRRRGGPAGRLDFSRDSLGPVWEWYLAANALPERPATDDEMRAADPPWWYDFFPSVGQEFGPNLARVLTGMAAYLTEAILRARPDATWSIGMERGGYDFQQPIVEIPPNRGGPLYQGFFKMTNIAFRRRDPKLLDPAFLQTKYDFYVHGDARPTLEPMAPPPEPSPYSVGSIPAGSPVGSFTHIISFDDVVAHEEEVRVAALVARLAKEPGIEAAVHEDRELVLLRSRLTTAAVAQVVDQTWAALG